MRYLISLAALALALSGFDLWSTCARSLIPRSLDTTVTEMELRHEKHPGVDDVCLIRTENERTVHIDSSIYADLSTGDRLVKHRGDRMLEVNGKPMRLMWSEDAHGMASALLVVLTVAAIPVALACKQLKSELVE